MWQWLAEGRSSLKLLLLMIFYLYTCPPVILEFTLSRTASGGQLLEDQGCQMEENECLMLAPTSSLQCRRTQRTFSTRRTEGGYGGRPFRWAKDVLLLLHLWWVKTGEMKGSSWMFQLLLSFTDCCFELSLSAFDAHFVHFFFLISYLKLWVTLYFAGWEREVELLYLYFLQREIFCMHVFILSSG